VVFDAGTHNTALEKCLAGLGDVPLGQDMAANGVVIDPGQYGPLQGSPDFGRCLSIHGLSVCPTVRSHYGVLVLAVHIPGMAHPVAVEIGLAGNGVVARTILYSLGAP